MSGETDSLGKSAGAVTCTCCETRLSESRLAVQSYPADETDPLEELEANGLALCEECAAEPVALLGNWEPHEPPAVAEHPAIGDAYAAVADACSFCSEPLGTEAVLGVECYRRPGERLPAYANYTLCPDCQSVLEEFLHTLYERLSRDSP